MKNRRHFARTIRLTRVGQTPGGWPPQERTRDVATSTAAGINSVQYEQIGVILEVTPRVNSDDAASSSLDLPARLFDLAMTASAPLPLQPVPR